MKIVLALAAVVVLAACAEAQGKPYCICPFDWNPVCGRNGITYGNECQGKCEAWNGAMPLTAGACPPPACLCPFIYDPVCANGVEYGNSCEAECSGVTDYGACS